MSTAALVLVEKLEKNLPNINGPEKMVYKGMHIHTMEYYTEIK